MSADTDAGLREQREVLREQLVAQRRLIARQLGRAPGPGFPRSVTMRFILEHPLLSARLLARVARLLKPG